MSRRRAVLALSAFSLLTLAIVGDVAPVRAQTDVEEATGSADRAAVVVDEAYAVVDSAVEDRSAVEAQLFEILDRYTVNSDRLVEISTTLEKLTSSLIAAEAQAASSRQTFENQAIAAYMEAVAASGTVLLDASTVESAMVTQETLGRNSEATLQVLDSYLAFSEELDTLRARTADERTRQKALVDQLESDSAELEQVFAAANSEVALAFDAARAAETRLSDALDEVRAAEAAEAERRRAEEAENTTTTAPPSTTTTAPDSTAPTTTTAPPSTTTTAPDSTAPTTTTTAPTTTTSAPSEWPPIPINSAVLSWRPVVEQHFSSDLVLDALVIMQCESLGDPNAINPYSGASGLFQFIPGTWAVASVSAGVGARSVFDGEANIIAASWLAEYYRSRGLNPWRPWSCRVFL